jgi:hypothetical protein
MIDQLLLNSCWDYKCIFNGQLYDMLTFDDTMVGIWLWLMYPLAIYGLLRLFIFDIPQLIRKIKRSLTK